MATESNGDFGWALAQLRLGKRVTREGWNGKGMWIALHRPDAHTAETGAVQLMTLPFLYLRTAGAVGHLVPWLPSQTDMLSGDWSFPEE